MVPTRLVAPGVLWSCVLALLLGGGAADAQPTPSPNPAPPPKPAASPADAAAAKPTDAKPPSDTDRPSRPSDEPPPLAVCLGDDETRKGVQEKWFLKRRKIELIPQGGLYASDLLSSSYIWGGTLSFYLTEDWGLETSFHVSPVALDVDESLTGFFGDSRFRKGTGYLGMASALWSPIHFKVKTNGGSIVNGDVAFALGGGKLWNDTTQGVAVGGGLVFELFLTKWLSLRLDIRDVILIQEVVAETRVTHNLNTMLGIGIWIPLGL
jgi:outer membrane beta-barrel protein